MGDAESATTQDVKRAIGDRRLELQAFYLYALDQVQDSMKACGEPDPRWVWSMEQRRKDQEQFEDTLSVLSDAGFDLT